MATKVAKYCQVDPNFKPLPKYGHLSEKTPLYTADKPRFDAMWEAVYSHPIPDEARRLEDEVIRELNDAIPRATDLHESFLKYDTRDGKKGSLKVYKTKEVANGQFGKPATMLINYHGGGYYVGSHEESYMECIQAVRQGNIVVVSVEYRMTPQVCFPVPIQDCFDALVWCKKNHEKLGVDPERIILEGSSAGGNIIVCGASMLTGSKAAAICLEARDNGVSGIIGQVLNNPWLCLAQFHPRDKYEMGSHFQNLDATMISYYVEEQVGDILAPDAKPDQRHSPLIAKSHANLPPALISAAGCDPLRDEAFAYKEALAAAGVEAEVYGYKGMPHVWWWYAPNYPETALFYERHNNFIRKLCV